VVADRVVGSRAAVDVVVAAFSGSLTADRRPQVARHAVVARSAEDQVVAAISGQDFRLEGLNVSDHPIVPVTRIDLVIAQAAPDQVVVPEATDAVVAAEAVDGVGPVRADDHVVALRPLDGPGADDGRPLAKALWGLVPLLGIGVNPVGAAADEEQADGDSAPCQCRATGPTRRDPLDGVPDHRVLLPASVGRIMAVTILEHNTQNYAFFPRAATRHIIILSSPVLGTGRPGRAAVYGEGCGGAGGRLRNSRYVHRRSRGPRSAPRSLPHGSVAIRHTARTAIAARVRAWPLAAPSLGRLRRSPPPAP
jgi:hypothetical protein